MTLDAFVERKANTSVADDIGVIIASTQPSPSQWFLTYMLTHLL